MGSDKKSEQAVTAQTVLDFWFNEHADKWFEKSEAFDQEIHDKFFKTWQQAAQGELVGWRDTIQGRLAEIIVLDQFSRNLHRGSPKSFAQDGMALVLAQEAIKLPEYQTLEQKFRKFIVMPYMHSESAVIHEQAVAVFTELDDEYTLDFEMRHKAIVDRFGRYPHRNEVLGRESTSEELAFLQEDGSSF